MSSTPGPPDSPEKSAPPVSLLAKNRKTMRSRVLSGLYWTGGVRFLGQLFTWGVTIIVIRLLKPEDYGLLAMATVFVAFLTMMADIGLGQALVQTNKLDENRLGQIFGAIIIIDVALFLVQFSVAPIIATFYSEPRLVDIIRVLATSFLLTIFTTIPTALLTRQLDFKKQSLVDFCSTIIGSITTLLLAWNGSGVWSLVYGTLLTAGCRAVAYNLLVRHLQWPQFSMRGVRGLIVFGGQMTIARLLWFIYSQADMFIAGKQLGAQQLGIYSVAMHLASLPVQKISSIINQVAFPAFARAQNEPAQMSVYLLKAVRILSFFVFPVLWGMSILAEELVAVALGNQWQQVTLPLQALALVMPIRMIGNFVPSATDGAGRADIGMKNLLISNAIMLPAFLYGSQWGLSGLCAAWVLASPVAFLINLNNSLSILDIRIQSVLAAMARPACCALAMASGIKLLQSSSLFSYSIILNLLAPVIAGSILYLASSMLINRKVVYEILDLRRK